MKLNKDYLEKLLSTDEKKESQLLTDAVISLTKEDMIITIFISNES
jgi:hypothetical protein